MRQFSTAVFTILIPVLLTACDATPPAATGEGGDQASGRAAPPAVITAAVAQPAEEPAPRPVADKSAAGSGDEAGAVQELDWDSLIPADWSIEKLMEEYDASDLSDDDPRAQELMSKLKTVWEKAPVVPELDGKRVKLPGFVVPLEMDAKSIKQFLLVPYYGACIHVPPPPTNQTVYVSTEPDSPFEGALFDVVWVTGDMRVEKVSNDMGDAGYAIHASSIEPYE